MRLIAYALCVLLCAMSFACYDDGSVPGWNCAEMLSAYESIAAPRAPDDDPPIDLTCPTGVRMHAAFSMILRVIRALRLTVCCAVFVQILRYMRISEARTHRRRFIFFIYPPRLAPPTSACSPA